MSYNHLLSNNFLSVISQKEMSFNGKKQMKGENESIKLLSQ